MDAWQNRFDREIRNPVEGGKPAAGRRETGRWRYMKPVLSQTLRHGGPRALNAPLSPRAL